MQEVRTALEIHAFDSEQGEEAAPDSIEASFPAVLPAAGRYVIRLVHTTYTLCLRSGLNKVVLLSDRNSPIPSPPQSRS
jgi:hypothetical protein